MGYITVYFPQNAAGLETQERAMRWGQERGWLFCWAFYASPACYAVFTA